MPKTTKSKGKTSKKGGLRHYKIHDYEPLVKERFAGIRTKAVTGLGRSGTVAVRSSRTISVRTIHFLAACARKATGLARFRILKRLDETDSILRAPMLYDEQHNLEGYIRHIVKDELKTKRVRKQSGNVQVKKI